MHVVPVMDVMRGQVVRGLAGRRDEYRPIESQLCADAQPETIAQSFAALGFRHVYLADLDAIGGDSEFSADVYADVIAAGLDLWVDAGLSTADDASRLAALRFHGRPLSRIVAGLESLAGPESLAAMCTALGPERLVFSLDLKDGTPLVGSPEWRGLSAEQIAVIALRAGVRKMIVLDLAGVGVGAGVSTLPLCRTLRCLDAELEIIAGGGVRGPADLDALARAGCNAALVASALHDGRLSADDALAV